MSNPSILHFLDEKLELKVEKTGESQGSSKLKRVTSEDQSNEEDQLLLPRLCTQ